MITYKDWRHETILFRLKTEKKMTFKMTGFLFSKDFFCKTIHVILISSHFSHSIFPSMSFCYMQMGNRFICRTYMTYYNWNEIQITICLSVVIIHWISCSWTISSTIGFHFVFCFFFVSFFFSIYVVVYLSCNSKREERKWNTVIQKHLEKVSIS